MRTNDSALTTNDNSAAQRVVRPLHAAIILAACSLSAAQTGCQVDGEPFSTAPGALEPCEADVDCKGDRVCSEDGECVDAEPAEPVCGDGVCEDGETSACADCAPEPVCGDGVCNGGETSACADCEQLQPVCGNGVCEPGETSACLDCASGADATLMVTNNSSYVAWYLYVVPCSATTWGDDLLGTYTLDPGYTFELTMAAGCWDYRAETGDAAVYWELRGNALSGGLDHDWWLTN